MWRARFLRVSSLPVRACVRACVCVRVFVCVRSYDKCMSLPSEKFLALQGRIANMMRQHSLHARSTLVTKGKRFFMYASTFCFLQTLGRNCSQSITGGRKSMCFM